MWEKEKKWLQVQRRKSNKPVGNTKNDGAIP